MIDDNLRYSGTIPDERLHDMHRDLRSPMGGGHGGSGGSGPRGAGVFLVDQVFTRSQDDTYQATKSTFLNPLHKASYGVRIGDIVLFYLNTEGILCTGIVTAISGDTVTFVKHDEISTVGFSPSIATTEITGGHRVTVTNEGGSESFDVMDGVQGPQGEPFEFDDFTPEQLEDLRSEIASVFYRKQETHVTVSDVPTSVVHIPFSDYTSSSILFVDIEGLSLCENIDYVINGNDIELASPITHADTIVNFKMLIVVALTQQDLDNIVASGIVDDVAEMVLDRFGDELPVVTHEDNGLMSSSDKIKLDGIAENANNFETVAAMQAATDLQDGMICHTNGFHSAGDGGAAYYTISATGTANGMDVLTCAGSLIATLVVTEPYVTPEQFGAYGDGTIDSTTTIQSSYDYAKEHGVQFVMRGTYLISDTLQFSDHSVSGHDSNILYSGTRDKAAIKLSGRLFEFSFGVIIDASAWSSNASSIRAWDGGWHGWESESYIGLKLESCFICRVTVTTIVDFTVGLELYSHGNASTANAWNTIDVQSIRNCKIGYHILNDGNGAWNNANTFNDTDITYQSSTTQFILANVERYAIKQEQVNNTASTSCNSNVFNSMWFEFHAATPYTAIYLQNMSYCVFSECRYEVTGVSNRAGIVVDFSNIPTSIGALLNRYVDATYEEHVVATEVSIDIPFVSLIPPNDKTLTVPSIGDCIDGDSEYRTNELFRFDADTQIKIASGKCILDGYLYGTIIRGNLAAVSSSGTIDAPITDNHITTNATSGGPALFVELNSANTTLEILTSGPLPFIQVFDSAGNQLTSDSNTVYVHCGNVMYQLADTRYSRYQPATSASHRAALSFDSTVKYVKVICRDPITVTIRSKRQVTITKVPPTELSYLDYSGLKSNSVPTITTLPLYTRIWDFRNLSALGGYWQLESNNATLEWVYYSA